MKKLSFVLLFSFALHISYGQAPRKWVHLGPELVAYKGDLSTYDGYSAAFHIGLQFNKKKRLNGGFNLGIGSVTGENRQFVAEMQTSKTPNRFFKTNFFYANYDLHVNIIKKDNFIVYFSQGIGFIRFTPEDQFGESLQDQPETREDEETYRNAAIMVPTKLGAMYFLPNYFGIGVEGGLFNTGTDYLDNISALGKSGSDNLLAFRFSFYVPLFRQVEE